MSIGLGKYQSATPRPRMSYAGKVIAAGVMGKAILMGSLVSFLAVTFADSVILVLISACATGVFGLLIVLVQTHAEQRMHDRLDALEQKGAAIEEKATAIEEKAQTIADVVTPEEK